MTKLERKLEKEKPMMEYCREIYEKMDESGRILTNYIYMDLVRRIKVKNLAEVSAAELSVKLVDFVRMG